MMPDREKVIEALRICRENLSTKSCRKCPYMRGRDGTGTCYPMDAEENGVHLCWQDLVDDAITLLKEQNEGIVSIESTTEQKKLADRIGIAVSEFWCGACHFNLVGCPKFCPNCGAEMRDEPPKEDPDAE